MSLAGILVVVGAVGVLLGAAFVLTRGSSVKASLEAAGSADTTTTIPKYHPRTAIEARLDAAYGSAFNRECQRIWRFAPNAVFVDPDALERSFVVGDCTRRLHAEGRRAVTVAAATAQGRRDAIAAAAALTPSHELCWRPSGSTRPVGCWDSRRPLVTSPRPRPRSTTP